MKRPSLLALLAIITALSMPALTSCQTREPSTLRLALLPIVDVLPMYVAEQNGYFEDEGIQVELVPVNSGQERDALMQAEEVDGMLTDLQGVGLFNQDRVQVKAVIMARKAYPHSPLFRLLAAPDSEINDVSHLVGVKIGVSKNTVIEYLTERMLQKSGLSTDQIVIEQVAAIPVRFEQLMNGQLQAATLPDPLASGAIAAGAKLIVDDSQFTEYSQSVLVFSLDTIENQPKDLTKFLTAWNRAVAELNANPESYRDLLIERGRVPESVQDSYAMPPFPEGEITSPEQWADVVAWLGDKGLIDREIPYQEAVDKSFLKK